jgi:hypothetical protein
MVRLCVTAEEMIEVNHCQVSQSTTAIIGQLKIQNKEIYLFSQIIRFY